MEDYNNPFKRANSAGYRFTFADLLTGPKFDNQE
jgi:hypothetical protein